MPYMLPGSAPLVGPGARNGDRTNLQPQLVVLARSSPSSTTRQSPFGHRRRWGHSPGYS